MPGIGVVISGIGGSFPQSSNVQDFGRDLLENKYLPTPTERWRYDTTLKIDAVCGQIPYQNFDDTFFGISKRLAKSTDPATKMGYVRCFEAIVDAGVHPQKMRGGNVGVYSSGGISEFEQLVLFNERHDGYVVMGYARAMLPNRISYIFDFKGPSCSMDSSWAGSHLALRTAADSIRSGACEAALVVGSYIGRFPEASALLRQLGFISDDGLTRSFDLRASGSVHSDCCVAFFLQRADQAKRCYAHLLAADFAYVGRGSNVDITLPSPRGIRDFITGMYRTHGIDPKRVAYLEADGSAHPVRDECELDAIDAALVKDCGRCVPLLVGSVRSNLGHADSVNGHAAICKAICAMESGVVPATLNHSEANTRVAGLVAGRLRVVDENTPLALTADSVVAVNTLGLSGSVGHSVLQANPRGPTSPQDPDEHLPRLVTLAATNEDTVQEAARRVQAAPFDTNFYRLVQDVFSPNISGFNYRSYVICPPSEGDSFPVEKAGPRPVWFVYSGMGSQWPGMGADLMRIPIFADTIERLHAALEDKGLDLKAILTDTGPEAFDNILKSFVGVTACQVALTNVLAAVGVVPDGFIGHSVGELGCAFADGCLSETEAILAAWARGVASNRSPLIKGMMAAIGLGYRDVLPRLPAAIDIACHNSAHSCTLSGPAADVRRFTDHLLAEGVFAKAVSVADIAYHSRYIQPAGPLLRQYLQQVTPKPKLRSPKWVSSSVPAELRGTDADRFCSADYQTNNLLGPVLFEEGLASIPRDALVIEIGPHGLLQPLLRRALREQVNVALTLRSSSDSVRFLLNAIGKISLYTSVPDVAALYPDVEFPVPRGTHSLASLLQWSIEPHDDMYSTMCRRPDLGLEVHNDSPSMKAHGTRLLPLSEQLNQVWRSVAHKEGLPVGTFPIIFRQVHVEDWVHLPAKGRCSLRAPVMPGTSEVVVVADGSRVVLQAYAAAHPDERPRRLRAAPDAAAATLWTKEQVYSHLSERGLEYPTKFRCISSVRVGEQDWTVSVTRKKHWSSFLEALVQIFLLRDTQQTECLRLPHAIRQIYIDPTSIGEGSDVTLRLNVASGVLSGDGVHVSGFSSKTTAGDAGGVRSLLANGHGPRQNGVELVSGGVSNYVDAGGAMGIALAVGGRLRPDPLLRWPVPEGWSAEDAATVPDVYAQTYLFLAVRAEAKAGESVLVHAGSSPIGQAAIRVASQLGCHPIYTTVQDDQQRALLMKVFPKLEPRYVVDGGAFEFEVRRMTQGRGVNIVVSGIGDEHLPATLRCLGNASRMLNVNKDGTGCGVSCTASARVATGCTPRRRGDTEDSPSFDIPKYYRLANSSVFTFSSKTIVNASRGDREKVLDVMSQGLLEGFVQPIVGCRDSNGRKTMRKSNPRSPGASPLNGDSRSSVSEPAPTAAAAAAAWDPCLPHASLVALGRGAARCAAGATGATEAPAVTELPSRGPPARHSRESQPVFVLPPFGVLDPDSRHQLAGLAARLLNAVLVVETVVHGGIKDTAAAVVEAMTSRQRHGPYNLLGWRLGAVLGLEVQRQLESRGRRGTLFLVHGHVGSSGARLPRLLPGPPVPHTEGRHRHTDPDARCGAEVLTKLLDAVATHDSDLQRPIEGHVHVIRTSVDDELAFDEDRWSLHVWTYNEHSLNSAEFAEYINTHGACSQLGGNEDLRISIAANGS